MLQALDLALARKDIRFEAAARTRLGYIYLLQNRLAEARAGFERALAIRQMLNQRNRSLEPHIGLAIVAWQTGCPTDARAIAESVYATLAQASIYYTAEGTQVYFLCHTLLKTLQDPRAAQLHIMAQEHLATRCHTLSPEEAGTVHHITQSVQCFFHTANLAFPSADMAG